MRPARTDPWHTRSQAVLLRHLLACERGLLEGYREGLQGPERLPVRQIELALAAMRHHRDHAEWLSQQIRALGGGLPAQADDLWIWRELPKAERLLEAERLSWLVWQDCLLSSFSHEQAQLMMHTIVADHDVLLQSWQRTLGHPSGAGDYGGARGLTP